MSIPLFRQILGLSTCPHSLKTRAGKGKTLVVGVTLPKMAPYFHRKVPTWNKKIEGLNDSIETYRITHPYAKFTYADAEGVPHDTENTGQPNEVKDDGLHYFSTGYQKKINVRK